MNLPTLTLDMNLLHEYWKQRDKFESVEKILNLAKDGKVELAVTARIHEDIPDPPLSEKLRELPELSIRITGSVARIGYWVIGRDMIGDEAFYDFYSTACKLARKIGKCPLDWRDWDHLQTHYLLRRDFFLTWDEGIICLAEALKNRFNIVVIKPEKYLQSL